LRFLHRLELEKKDGRRKNVKIAWQPVSTNLIESKVLQERRSGGVGEKDTQHLLTGVRKQFLGISRVGDRLSLLGVAEKVR
jgi:hypothetical protein